ncbi:MAG: hypothetical protein ACON5B_01850 [Myxococcota bacterium]
MSNERVDQANPTVVREAAPETPPSPSASKAVVPPAPAKTLPMVPPPIPQEPEAPATAPTACDDLRDTFERAACEAAQSGAIGSCEALTQHDDRLHCFAIARRSDRACTQVMDNAREAQCRRDVEAAAPLVASPSPSARSQAAGATANIPRGAAAGASFQLPTPLPRRSSGCAAFEGDQAQLCRALLDQNAEACSALGHHDAKLFCYGVLRNSRSACVQVMSPELEAQCLASLQ